MAHTHPHTHNYSDRPHPEFVALDLGGEIGALILHTDAGLHGVEIEISQSGADERRAHKQVLERRAGGEPAFTAVYDGLAAGTYTLWLDGVARVRDVQITGGEIAELDWGRVVDRAAA